MGGVTEEAALRLGQVWRTADGNKAVLLVSVSRERVEGLGLVADRFGATTYHSHNQLRLGFPVLVFDPPAVDDRPPTSAMRLRWGDVGRQTVSLLRDLAGAKGRLTIANWNEMVGRKVIAIVETSPRSHSPVAGEILDATTGLQAHHPELPTAKSL